MILKNSDLFKSNPKSIVSLVPSITELLHYLGLENEISGITKFCIKPEIWKNPKQIIGGTKNINTEKILELSPELVIANKEENVKYQVEKISDKLPVWLTDVVTYEDALFMIEDIGLLTDKRSASKLLIENIENAFANEFPKPSKYFKAAYFIWKNPYMIVGGDNFINSMMEKSGFINVFANELRYPEITIDHEKFSDCEVIMLSTEPYPFNETHITELNSAFPDKKIILVNGEMFSWYGSRLLYAPAYFSELRARYLM